MIVIDKDNIEQKVDYESGCVFLVDKPLDWTSFDVVNKIRFSLRSLYGRKKFKVGHNGTLDPLASGLLMIFVGKYTKLIPNEENHDKRYESVVKLGATTESLDRELEEIDFKSFDHVDLETINKTAMTFLGESMQEIPVYSAAKINGRAMYKLARAGKKFKPKSKPVIIHSIDVKSYDAPFISIDILCGKGTYVRAFARDIGQKLNTSAYLYALRRTGISNFSVDKALSIDEICKSINKEN